MLAETSPEIRELQFRLAKLPSLGPRSARRILLSLLENPEAKLWPLVNALQNAAENIKTCQSCGNLDTQDPCFICSNPKRDGGVICVVESVGDLWTLERTGLHKGLYQVLGGCLSALGGRRPQDLNLAGLLGRIERQEVKEIILALPATLEGGNTTHWLHHQVKDTDIRVTRLGQGVPAGGSVEVLDDGTLASALLSRCQINS
ncbi:recombination protein RecR [Acetobacteraceae bacterium]|nr:recombination protein RecR [Acetobacteraceae bacterium]